MLSFTTSPQVQEESGERRHVTALDGCDWSLRCNFRKCSNPFQSMAQHRNGDVRVRPCTCVSDGSAGLQVSASIRLLREKKQNKKQTAVKERFCIQGAGKGGSEGRKGACDGGSKHIFQLCFFSLGPQPGTHPPEITHGVLGKAETRVIHAGASVCCSSRMNKRASIRQEGSG